MRFIELTQNQLRVATDINQTFQAYRDVVIRAAGYAGGMSWKRVNGRDYLIKVINRRGGTKSLGPRTEETERIAEEFFSGKARAKARQASMAKSMAELAGMARGVGIHRVPSIVSATLRKLDESGLLGKNLIVIGTNALYAYEAVAGVMFDTGLLATTDIDFLWDARTSLKLGMLDDDVANAGLLAVLRKVDKTFEPLGADGFRAVNERGFSVDLVKQSPVPPWRIGVPERLAVNDLRPSWLEHIGWLLSSTKFSSVVIGQDGMPAPMIAPDPRAFVMYKLWLSRQLDREPAKVPRDRIQALAVADLVIGRFPHLPFDEDAMRMFPETVRDVVRAELPKD